MGRHLLRLAQAVCIVLVTIALGVPASGEVVTADGSGESGSLRVEGTVGAIEIGWVRDEAGTEPCCGTQEAEMLGGRLILAPDFPLGVTLHLGLNGVELEFGLGNGLHGGVALVGGTDASLVAATACSGCGGRGCKGRVRRGTAEIEGD